MRRQIFRQIVLKRRRNTNVFQGALVRYDGKSASRLRAKPTDIGWYFFGETNIKYLFGKKAVKIYALLVVGFIVLGSTLKVDLV